MTAQIANEQFMFITFLEKVPHIERLYPIVVHNIRCVIGHLSNPLIVSDIVRSDGLDFAE